MLRGRVLEAGAATPVAGADVRAACHEISTVTDADGAWRLLLPPGPHELVIEHLAFATETVAVPAGTDSPVRIRLTPRPVALSVLVVTASRRLQQLKDVPIATEVVGRAELERSGSPDLSAVLTERTGVSVEGGHPIGQGVMLQGLGSERVLVLLDGQPFIGRLSGSLDLSRIPTSMIERVEVVKGPQSTLYGSDAMGGVVNVITRSPAQGVWKGGVDVTGGSNGRIDITGNVLGGIGDAAYAIDGGRRTIELVPGHSGESGTFATRWDGNARVQWELSDALAVSAGGLVLDERQRWRTGPVFNFVDNVQWGARTGAVYSSGAHRFSPTLYATEFRHLTRRSTLPQPVAGSDDEQEIQRLLEAELLYAYAGDAVAIDAGVELRREGIHSDRVDGHDRALHSAEPFAQATWTGGSWSVVPGVRLSWSEQWGAHLTPRVAAMLRPSDHLAVRASVGRGFRAPSFKELYMDFLNTGAGAGYRVRGNPELRPESSTNVSGSVEWSGERVYSRVQLFYNRFDDFIETRELAPDSELMAFTYANIDDGETWGTELELGTTWGGLRAEAGYAWLRARDRTSGETLLGRPEHSARGSLGYALAFGLRANASATYSGPTPISRLGDGTLVERAALTRVDARVAQSLPWGLELSAGIDNIFDAVVAEYPGYLGRQVYLGLGWRGARELN
ncbi:MAG TPA: TonB-dependent receptor [Longimicrobiales bacterium]|nr:TonB-dependent receptor [Longimicrobiales bacterium]